MKLYITLYSIFFLLAIGIWVFASHMEAKSYNKLTGANATTWDAMWIKLRVQASPMQISNP